MQKNGKRKRTESSYHKSLDLIGGRIAVYWNEDKIYYRGQVVAFNKGTGTYTVYYDDGLKEQVDLAAERFRWLLPRGRSAGYCPEIRHVFADLGAENIVENPQEEDEQKQSVENVIEGEDCVGYNVGIYWGCDGSYMLAEIVAFNPKTGQHHVLYRDGEGEWLSLKEENVKWYQRHRFSSFAAGVLEDGKQPPRGRGAVGWRIGIYWKQFKCFRECRVEAYDSATGKHKVIFVDGSQSDISLSNVRVIWRLPPNITDVSDISVQQRSRTELLKLAGIEIQNSAQDPKAVRLISPNFVASSSPLIFIQPTEKNLRENSASETTTACACCASDEETTKDQQLFSNFAIRNQLPTGLQNDNQLFFSEKFQGEQFFEQNNKSVTSWGSAKLGKKGRLQISVKELDNRLELCNFWLRRIEQAQDTVGNFSRIFNSVQLIDQQCSQQASFSQKSCQKNSLKHRSLTALHLEQKGVEQMPVKLEQPAQ